MGTVNHGVYVSDDGGISWKPSNEGLTDTNVLTLTGNDSSLLAGTTTGIFLSTDNGALWNEVLDQERTQSFYGKGDTIYALTSFAALGGQLFKSFDGGKHWNPAAPNPNAYIPRSPRGITAFALEGDEQFVALDTVILVSGDNGISWSLDDAGLPNTAYYKDASIYTILSDGAITVAGTEGCGAFRSTDSGKNWKASNSGLPQSGDNYGGYATINGFVKLGTIIFAATSGGVYCSLDSGRSWSNACGGLSNTDVKAVFVEDSTLYATTYGGLFTSTDTGKLWQNLHADLTDWKIYGAYVGNVNAFVTLRNCIFAGTSHGLLTSSDSGITWEPTGSGLTNNEVSSLTTDGSDLYVGTLGEGVLISSDNGISWQPTSLTCPVGRLTYHNGRVFAAAFYQGLFVSDNDGVTWSKVTDARLTGHVGYLFADTNIFATTGGPGYNAAKSEILISKDNGNSWTDITPPWHNGQISTMSVMGGSLFLGTWGNGIYVSKDKGLNWSDPNMVDSGTEGTDVCALVPYQSNLFAGTPNGLYLSTDYGASWSAIEVLSYDGLYPGLCIDGSYLIMGILDGSIYRRPLSEIIPPSAVSNPPSKSQNIQVYPNPFTQSTKISFSLAEAGYADVSIVNVLGAEVARLHSGTLGAGEHTFTWNPEGAAPGNYWCLVRTSTGVQRIGLSKE